MVKELRRELLADGTVAVAKIAGQLTGSAGEMAQESSPRLGVGSGSRGADDRVNNGSRCRSQERQQGVKALLLRRIEVREMGVEDTKPKLRPVLP